MNKPKILKYIATALALAGAAAMYFMYDPVSAGWFPRCPFKVLTGLSCPGCGFQRAFHASLHGRFAEAWHYNLFYIISLPYLLMAVWGQFRCLPYSGAMHRLSHGRRLSTAFVILLFAWWVLRNVLQI